MAQSKSDKRRFVTVLVIVTVALVGLALTLTGRTGHTTQLYATNAGQGSDSTSTAAYSGGISGASALGSVAKMLGALVVVVISIYAALFFLKKTMNRRSQGRGCGNALEILETAHIAPKKTISLVRVAGKSVLVGVTEQQISLLTELDAETTSQITRALQPSAGTERFADLLRSAASKLKEIGTRTTPTAAA